MIKAEKERATIAEAEARRGIQWGDEERMKDIAKHVIDTMPNQATMDEIIHALYVNAKFQNGEIEIEIREDNGASQPEAKQRLQRWLK